LIFAINLAQLGKHIPGPPSPISRKSKEKRETKKKKGNEEKKRETKKKNVENPPFPGEKDIKKWY
jgi:hypothetical protein